MILKTLQPKRKEISQIYKGDAARRPDGGTQILRTKDSTELEAHPIDGSKVGLI